MRCSSCEPLLDQYIERALSPRVMLRVAKHVHACKACHALLNELRSVDGLLLGSKQPELPPNFTFAVMAEVRSMPVARRRRVPAWLVLSGYLAAAWIVAAVTFVLRGGHVADAVPALAGVTHLGAWHAVANAFHSFAPATPLVAAGVAFVLAVDVALFAALFVFHRAVRPQLAAHLAPVPVEIE